MKKKLELPPVPAVVPDKEAGVRRWVGGIVQTGESGGCNDHVAALEELVKRLRKVDGQQERILADLNSLKQAVVSRGQEDGAVIAAQRETVDRWKQVAGGVVEELRQLTVSEAGVSDARGRVEAQSKGTGKKKKKLETPVVPVVVPDSHEAEKVYPSEETKGVVPPVDEAVQVAEGSANSGEASAACSTGSGPAAAAYKKPAFLAKK
jgi:hypothetical protein